MRRSIYQHSFAWLRYKAQRERRQQRIATLFDVLHLGGIGIKGLLIFAMLYLCFCVMAF